MNVWREETHQWPVVLVDNTTTTSVKQALPLGVIELAMSPLRLEMKLLPSNSVHKLKLAGIDYLYYWRLLLRFKDSGVERSPNKLKGNFFEELPHSTIWKISVCLSDG